MARNHSEIGALKIVDPKAFRERVMDAICTHSSQGKAAEALGVSVRQLQRYLAEIDRTPNQGVRRARA